MKKRKTKYEKNLKRGIIKINKKINKKKKKDRTIMAISSQSHQMGQLRLVVIFFSLGFLIFLLSA
jgi:hypothetical protein